LESAPLMAVALSKRLGTTNDKQPLLVRGVDLWRREHWRLAPELANRPSCGYHG